MANAGHSSRIHPDLAHISGNVRPIAALWKIWEPNRIQGAFGDLGCAVGGRARASARKLRAGGHEMYDKAETYTQNANLAESLWY